MKYIRITRRIFGMLSLRLREGALMVALLGVYAVLEGFGIGLLLPVLEYLESGGQDLPTGGVWPYLEKFTQTVGIPLNLGTLLLLAFIPILLRQAVYYLNTWYNAVVQNRAVEKLMVRAFKSVGHAEVSFIDAHDQGRLLNFVTGQVSRAGTVLTTYVRLLSTIAIIAVYVILLGVLSWQLTVIAVLATGAVSAAVRGILVRTRAHGKEVTDASVAMSSAVRERLAAIRLVKMRAREDAEADFIGVLAAQLRDATTRIAVASAGVEVIVDPALMLSVFLIIWVGVTQYGMTLASLGLFMFILLRLNAKTKEVNVGRQQLASLMPSFDFVEATLVKAEAAATPCGGERRFKGLERGVEFRDVRFSYGETEEVVLKGVTFSVPKGSMTAVVGRSGAGKSTLMDMIPLLRTPTSGEILFDGVDTRDFELASLRKRIGFLAQTPIMFNDTIYSNLIYGLDTVPGDEQIRQALDESYCTEFVQPLPKGLNTRLGDQGARFSGGQRQRLALARVFLQDPDILILDEPTSALDSESEQYIQQAFERIAKERTVFVIAHRLATVQHANQIVVLHEGRIAEIGTHVELMDKPDGPYRRLFDMQIRA